MNANLAETPLILLAAGRSRRMGAPKWLLEVAGKPLYLCQAEAYWAAGGKRVYLVLSPEGATHPVPSQLQVLVNPEPERGQFSSAWVAFERVLADPVESVFLQLVDGGVPQPELYQELAQELGPEKDLVIPVVQGRGGHPILLGARFLEFVVQNCHPAQDILKHQIQAWPSERKVFHPTSDPTILSNLNEPKDFQAWLQTNRQP